jgi:hypothetical protein
MISLDTRDNQTLPVWMAAVLQDLMISLDTRDNQTLPVWMAAVLADIWRSFTLAHINQEVGGRISLILKFFMSTFVA